MKKYFRKSFVAFSILFIAGLVIAINGNGELATLVIGLSIITATPMLVVGLMKTIDFFNPEWWRN